MSKHLYGLILLATISFASSPALAEVYRWIDEQGNVHFGDKAHADKRAQNITEDIKLKNIDSSAQRTQQSLQHIELRQQAQSVESQQRQAGSNSNKQKREETCQKAQQRLRILQGRVYFVDEEGKEVKVSENERQQRADALQSEIKQYCS